MIVKTISIAMAKHTKQTSLQSKVIVHICAVSCDVATQLDTRKLVTKFILSGFIQ